MPLVRVGRWAAAPDRRLPSSTHRRAWQARVKHLSNHHLSPRPKQRHTRQQRCESRRTGPDRPADKCEWLSRLSRSVFLSLRVLPSRPQAQPTLLSWAPLPSHLSRGASHRRSTTSVAASGSSLQAALARRAPPAGVRRGGASTARPTRSAGRGPRGRRLGPTAFCARASPSLGPVGGPGLLGGVSQPCCPLSACSSLCSPVFLSLLVTWPAWRVLSTLKLSHHLSVHLHRKL